MSRDCKQPRVPRKQRPQYLEAKKAFKAAKKTMKKIGKGKDTSSSGSSEDGVDETNCESEDSEVASCVHFQQKQDQTVQKSVVIQESVRCAIFDTERSPALYPYCADFEDQTNCLDTNRVG